MQAPITDTGVRGFLKWFQRDQPALYKKVAPLLPSAAPGAFSGYRRRLGSLRAIYKDAFARRSSSSQRLGDYYSLPEVYISAPAIEPISVDYTAQLTGPISYTQPVSVDYSSQLSTPAYTAQDVNDTLDQTPTAPIDTSGGSSIANAANTGSASQGTIAAIGNTIASVASSLMSANSLAALMGLIGAQLGNAKAGTAPSSASSKGAGIPVVKTGMNTTTVLILLGLAGSAAWILLE